MKKNELLEKIETSHRQLERYIFYFKKCKAGEFSASTTPKFSREEMVQAGIYGKWALKDLLANIIHWENLTTAILIRKHHEISRGFPDPGSTWGDILKADLVPSEIQKMELEYVFKEFHHSFEDLYAGLLGCSGEEFYEVGFCSLSGEYATADYLSLLTVELYDWTKGAIRKWRRSRVGVGHNKQVILERIRTERRRLEKNLAAISHQDMHMSGVVGKWSVKDLLAHLTEWERMFLRWYEAGRCGETTEIPAPGYAWGDMDALNESIFQKHCNRPLQDVLANFEDSYQQVYELVDGMPDNEIFAIGSYKWVGSGNLASYILANTANHYRWAKEKVRAWMNAKREI